ncbi:Retrovirus-related Pol polyprotein, partial [Mucuna pruriens]
MEVFMDDFTVYADSFDACLENLSKVLRRCIDTNLVLNFEKCHFMVIEGIVLGHLVSNRGIEMDKLKIDIITSLPNPTLVREVRSFLGHLCVEAFQELKSRLTSAPILQAPNWDLPFELMCDASNSALGAVLGQRARVGLPVHWWFTSDSLSVEDQTHQSALEVPSSPLWQTSASQSQTCTSSIERSTIIALCTTANGENESEIMKTMSMHRWTVGLARPGLANTESISTKTALLAVVDLAQSAEEEKKAFIS